MGRLARLVGLVLTCVVLLRQGAAADPQSTRPLVLVHGTVRDYGGRVVEKARVSFNGLPKPIETDRQGQFTARAPARAFVSASKDDMLGHVVLGDASEQTVTIRMDQMPI